MERWSNVATGTLVRNVQSTFGQRCEPWGWANVRATFGQRSGNVQAESPRVRGHPLVQMSRRAGPAFGCRGRRSARYVSVLRFFSWQSTLTLVDSIAGCIAEVRSDGERGKRRGGGRRSMHAQFFAASVWGPPTSRELLFDAPKRAPTDCTPCTGRTC